MKYCTQCLYPDTKPDLSFNVAGVCSACQSYAMRAEIDWDARRENFTRIMHLSPKHSSTAYDCVVPVSGGKDSTYQIVECLRHGLKPLAVTAMTCDLSPLGWKNLQNISDLGVDHVMVQTNRALRAKINKFTLETIGDISWAEHVLIFTVPIREAIQRGIRVIIYGENPQNEYGGPNHESQFAKRLDKNWLQEFGGLNGLRVQDLVDYGIATHDDLFQYTYPSSLDLYGANIEALFLGQFFPWNGEHNAGTAVLNGFTPYHGIVEGSACTYENLDNYQTGIHDYFKYLKFGFGRATDIVNNRIRRGTMTREKGIEIIEHCDGAWPKTYLGEPVENILERIGITSDEFYSTVAKFANKKLFDVTNGPYPRQLFKVGQDFKC